MGTSLEVKSNSETGEGKSKALVCCLITKRSLAP